RAVCLINGTTGWEALQAGKAALVFGYPWYLRAPGVVRVEDVEGCRETLQRGAGGEVPGSIDHVRRDQRIMRERFTERMIYANEFIPFSTMTPAQHAASYARLVDRLMQERLGAPAQDSAREPRTGEVRN